MTVAVIGGGASGLIAAYAASARAEVHLFEKNEKLGKKIYITGKGRCNVTNDCDEDEFLKNIVTNPKFIYSSIRAFSPADLKALLTENGVPLKTERGNRVFPVSDKASDITRCFEKLISRQGVHVHLNSEIKDILFRDGHVCGLKTADGDFECDKVIVCTGGVSYPSTGSTGDGYKFAKAAGHSVSGPVAALTGLNLCGNDYADLQGLTLKNVGVKITDGEKVIFSDFGEILFTHFGVSGPVILTASSKINRLNVSKLTLSIDLKPALCEEALDVRILRDFAENKNKDFRNSLFGLLPKTLVLKIVERSGIDPYMKVNEITSKDRYKLLKVLKNYKFDIHSLRPVEEGIVTSGGVSVKEINPKTMESKIVKGLFFAGEVLDVDALTGGFNLQIAFSTGYAAGNSCGE